MKTMKGVNVPVSCPMLPDQQVDYESLRSLCNYLIEKGVHGLYPNGTTGEMCYLTLEERKKVLETCLEAAGGRVPVFAMVGANSTKDTIELAQHAEQAGADGIGVVTPYYFKLDPIELEEYFVRVAGSVPGSFSVYLYGIPQLAVNDITPELAQKIASRCHNVIGIKYSYPDMSKIMRFMNINGGQFSVLAGPDDLFLTTLCSGGDGVMSGTANVIPEHFVAIYNAFQAGNLALARILQKKTNRLIDVISGPNNLSRYKVCLRYRGVIKYDTVREPMRTIDIRKQQELIEAIETLHFLEPETD